MFKLEINNEIHLELVHFSHAKEMLSLVNKNRELFSEWLLWVNSVREVEDEKKHIQSALEAYAKGQLVNCSIFYRGSLAGNVEIGMRKGYGIKKGELGYWLGEAFHGKGIMSHATAKMLEIGFEQYNLDKIMLKCAVKNERSCNVAKKLGMSHEGRQRDEIVVNGVVMDVDSYAILKKEYQKIKKQPLPSSDQMGSK
jgi:ribosomal-protein-serine acetyltransferase